MNKKQLIKQKIIEKKIEINDSTNKCEQFLSKTIFVKTDVKKIKKKRIFFSSDEKLIKQLIEAKNREMRTKVKIIEKLMKLLKAERMLQNAIDTIERSKLIEKLMLTNDRN